MNAIAEHAGVRRATVYNHFPTELELIDACSSHWFEQNPPPDPAEWLSIPDPVSRVRAALTAMYDYFDSGQEMLEKVLRDSPLVPALEEIIRTKWRPLLDYMVDSLAGGWTSSASSEEHSNGRHDHRRRATLQVALDFFTWKTLTGTGLSNEDAADLVVFWIDTL